jgi:hypothetical protein
VRSGERTDGEARQDFGEDSPSERKSNIAILQLQWVGHMERGYVVAWLQFEYDRTKID